MINVHGLNRDSEQIHPFKLAAVTGVADAAVAAAAAVDDIH